MKKKPKNYSNKEMKYKPRLKEIIIKATQPFMFQMFEAWTFEGTQIPELALRCVIVMGERWNLI